MSRIFWCPTGTLSFLSIHAAGFYNEAYSQPRYKVYDYVVSSYVPSLASFASTPNSAAIPRDNLRLLVVPQPSSDGQPYLPGVVAELNVIEGMISKLASTTLVRPPRGTVEEVLALMKDTEWVHFACHGVQDNVDSGLCLADRRRLKVRDIIGLSRPRGGLAFLSACHTAKGDHRLSDEALHITAGMLFAGYEGVIGTMWFISDRLAPEVARGVYERLFRDGTKPDHREAARALHEAIAHVRDSRGAPFDE